MQLSFAVIGLNEHKIRPNTSINKRLYQVTPFTLMRQKAPMVEQVYSCIQRNGLNVLLNNNLESTFIEISLPRKRNFLCIYKHPHISITDYFFNFSQSTFAKVK